jgi:hypothetical protein
VVDICLSLCYNSFTVKQSEIKIMTDQARVRNIVALAEDLYADGEYADMAHDAIVTSPERDDYEIAQELAMRWYGQ